MQLLTDFIQPGNVYFRNKVYGPDEIIAGINSVARYLGDNLVSKSPFIYLFATNHVKTACAYFGIIKAHKICVLMDPKIGRLELAEKLLDTPPAACIRIISETESFDFSKEIEIGEQPWKDGEEDLSDVCTMIYTAADDGYAKAVMLTHENLLANAKAISEVEAFSRSTVSCAPIGFSHLLSLQGGLIAPFIGNGSILIEDISDSSRLVSFIESINNFKVTNFYAVPLVYLLLTKASRMHKKIKYVISFGSGGYKLSEEIYQKYLSQTGQEIHEGYGLSEASPVCTWHPKNCNINIQSVGKAFPYCEISIKDNRDNYPGEICVRGVNVMKGYYNHPQQTKKVLIDGWLHTGDLGYIDKNGFVYLTGRIKNMINRGGKKIYPAELERYIKLNENVIDAEVYGDNHSLFGQNVNAKIKLFKKSEYTQESFFKWFRENISQYKIPSKVEFT